jgi:hypothetical protein
MDDAWLKKSPARPKRVTTGARAPGVRDPRDPFIVLPEIVKKSRDLRPFSTALAADCLTLSNDFFCFLTPVVEGYYKGFWRVKKPQKTVGFKAKNRYFWEIFTSKQDQ